MSMSGAWLQDNVGAAYHGSLDCKSCHWKRRRELLETIRAFRSHPNGWLQPREKIEALKHDTGYLPGPQISLFETVQYLGYLGSVIGPLPRSRCLAHRFHHMHRPWTERRLCRDIRSPSSRIDMSRRPAAIRGRLGRVLMLIDECDAAVLNRRSMGRSLL